MDIKAVLAMFVYDVHVYNRASL